MKDQPVLHIRGNKWHSICGLGFTTYSASISDWKSAIKEPRFKKFRPCQNCKRVLESIVEAMNG